MNEPTGTANFSKIFDHFPTSNIKKIFFFPLTKDNMNKNDQELVDMAEIVISSNLTTTTTNTNESETNVQKFIIIKISDDDSVSREIVDLSETAPKLEIYALSHNIIRANDSMPLTNTANPTAPANQNYINCKYCGTKNRSIRDHCYECTNFL
jgi:hypothetical protein